MSKTTHKRWIKAEELVLINSFNDAQTESDQKDKVVDTVFKRFQTNPTYNSRTKEQIRRKLERLILDQDSRIKDLKGWIHEENGAMRKEKVDISQLAQELSRKLPTQRELKDTRTYNSFKVIESSESETSASELEDDQQHNIKRKRGSTVAMSVEK